MPLLPCEQCSAKISDVAEACPHCGHPQPASQVKLGKRGQSCESCGTFNLIPDEWSRAEFRCRVCQANFPKACPEEFLVGEATQISRNAKARADGIAGLAGLLAGVGTWLLFTADSIVCWGALIFGIFVGAIVSQFVWMAVRQVIIFRRAVQGFSERSPAWEALSEVHFLRAAATSDEHLDRTPLGELVRHPVTWGVLLVVLIVGGSWVYFSYLPTQYRHSISRVLQDDKQISVSIAQEAGFLDVAWDQSGIVGKAVEKLRWVDLSGCPSEFKDAFRAHIAAWAKYEQIAKRYGGFRGFMKGFFTGGGTVFDAASEGGAAQDEIQRTWREVLRIAKQYNADIPG
jgi:hypothetical protein